MSLAKNSCNNEFEAGMGESGFQQIDLSGKLIIKVQFGDDIRRIPIHNEALTLDELVLMMQRVFRGKLSASDDLTIKYMDQDGDLITIFDSSDLSFAIQYSRVLKLKIFLGKQDALDKNFLKNLELIEIRKQLCDIRDQVNHLLDSLGNSGVKLVESDKNNSVKDKSTDTPSEKPQKNIPTASTKDFDPLQKSTSQQVEKADVPKEPPHNIVPQNMVSQNSIPQNMVPQNVGPQISMPHNSLPQNIMPQNTVDAAKVAAAFDYPQTHLQQAVGTSPAMPGNVPLVSSRVFSPSSHVKLPQGNEGMNQPVGAEYDMPPQSYGYQPQNQATSMGYPTDYSRFNQAGKIPTQYVVPTDQYPAPPNSMYPVVADGSQHNPTANQAYNKPLYQTNQTYQMPQQPQVPTYQMPQYDYSAKR